MNETNENPINEKSVVETTFGLIKPDGMARGALMALKAIERHGLVIAATRVGRMSATQAQVFYREHLSKWFFLDLSAQMSSGPLLSMVIAGFDAIARYRALLGATDPTKAEKGTLRQIYGTALPDNAFHGSDSVKSATREIKFALDCGLL